MVINAARKLLEDFERLLDSDRSELVPQPLRRSRSGSHEPATHDELVSAADHLFV